jgi:hypothetical protein
VLELAKQHGNGLETQAEVAVNGLRKFFSMTTKRSEDIQTLYAKFLGIYNGTMLYRNDPANSGKPPMVDITPEDMVGLLFCVSLTCQVSQYLDVIHRLLPDSGQAPESASE